MLGGGRGGDKVNEDEDQDGLISHTEFLGLKRSSDE